MYSGVCTSVCYVYVNILIYILICMVVEKRGSFEPRYYLRLGYDYCYLMCSLRKKIHFHSILPSVSQTTESSHEEQPLAVRAWCCTQVFYTWSFREFPGAASDHRHGHAVALGSCWLRRGFPPYFHELLAVKNEQIYFLCLAGLVRWQASDLQLLRALWHLLFA